MIKLNNYINEAWSGVKKHTNNANIEAWCEEMRIENYTINSKGEIDVDGTVSIIDIDSKELPYKFGRVNKLFLLYGCQNLTSLKNCPYYVGDSFGCRNCPQLDSLEGCPVEVKGNFVLAGSGLKDQFTEKEIRSLCKVKKKVILNY